jgi:hypothetical protein
VAQSGERHPPPNPPSLSPQLALHEGQFQLDGRSFANKAIQDAFCFHKANSACRLPTGLATTCFLPRSRDGTSPVSSLATLAEASVTCGGTELANNRTVKVRNTLCVMHRPRILPSISGCGVARSDKVMWVERDQALIPNTANPQELEFCERSDML